MQLYIARHGRTNYNDLGLCNSNRLIDVHLTKLGEEQAKALGDKLKNEKFEQIYVSELRRTMQTAVFVNKYHHVPITVEAKLNDINTGYEGQHFTLYVNALERAGRNRLTARFNFGESVNDLNIRVSQFLNSVKTKGLDSVLIITSEVVIQSIYQYFDPEVTSSHPKEIIQGDFVELLLSSN